MGGLPVLHVNTTLLILMSALYADAHLRRVLPARTKRQARERAARCASRSIKDGGFERAPNPTSKHLHRHRRRRSPLVEPSSQRSTGSRANTMTGYTFK